jgi:hypothetical protein
LKTLSESEVNERFARSPEIGSDAIHCSGKELFFSNPEANCIDIEYPPKLERISFLVRCLATLGYEDRDFEGAILWFTDWGVWNLLDEGVGYRIVEAMHRASGQPLSFETAPGHLFRADELQEAVGMLLQPMIFGWDAFFAPHWSYGYPQFFLHVSHDSFVSVVTRTKEFHVKAFGILQELGLNPTPGHELRMRRFCRVA